MLKIVGILFRHFFRSVIGLFKPSRRLGRIFGALLIIGIGILIFATYRFNWSGTGIPHKNLWDWLQLLAAWLIPVVIAIFSLRYSQQQTQTENSIAFDNQRENALQSYLDKMSDLLLHEKLRDSNIGDDLRNVARARTLTVLPRLDANRKGSLLRFLFESNLINIINLSNANLTGADLRIADLNHANLSGANLSGANLSSANLISAYLNYSDMRDADLSHAKLFDCNIMHANLTGTKLIDTKLAGSSIVISKLMGADLSNLDLSFADLRYSDLSSANLSNTKLFHTSLDNANLKGANLINTDLKNAELKSADLSGTDLNSINLTEKQRRQIKFIINS